MWAPRRVNSEKVRFIYLWEQRTDHLITCSLGIHTESYNALSPFHTTLTSATTSTNGNGDDNDNMRPPPLSPQPS
jgi:hypothetical protein